LELAKEAVALQAQVDSTALEDLNKLEDDAVQVEVAALTKIQEIGEAAVAIEAKVLHEYLAARIAILDKAQKAISELEGCAEWLAYHTAELALAAAKASSMLSSCWQKTELLSETMLRKMH
jgi:hypothetical protein